MFRSHYIIPMTKVQYVHSKQGPLSQKFKLSTISIVSQVLNGLHSAYHLHGSFMQLQKGAFFTKLFVTSRSKIEECKVTESFLQRLFGLASVSVYTRADPIRETTMKDIPKEMAVRYYHWYAKKEE
ncbi:PH domain-containing protein [Caldalkalibacillus mannanilyticus]|uniref:PH domain-containing protein n=1 Tax=Caldalkalibacillus mannanilyticus TaxID=1418 RepID=UPI000684642D|nr:PH domain-containing protein [Caldalkalibacillus mannanilyticus]